MGLRKEREVLLLASGCAAVGAAFIRWTVIRCVEGESWLAIAPYGLMSMWCTLSAFICLDIWRLKPANSHTLKSLLVQYFLVWMLRLLRPYSRWYIRTKTMDPEKENRECLHRILEDNKNSSYGKENNFSQIKSREDFVRMHPVTTQEHYQSYMDRIAAGEKNVMYPGETLSLISTSGTTGQAKVYAWQDKYVRSIQFSFGVFGYSTINGLINLQRAVVFHIASPMRKTSGKVTIGAGSQLLYQNFAFDLIPSAFIKLYAEDASFYTQAVFTLAERELLFMAGFSADLMYSYWKFITENWNHICDDINNGKIGNHISMPEDIRVELSERLIADPARAAELREAMKMGIVGLAKQIWPSIGFVYFGKSAAFKMCAGILMESYFKGVKVFGLFHVATEGITGFNMEEEDAHVGEVLTLAPYPCFMEFIPLDDVEEDNPKTLFPEQLQVGDIYEVVTTSANGLYRCRYGDVIKIVGFKNNTPKYEFIYRLGQRLNIAYERTPDKFLYEAIKQCERKLLLGVKLVNYTTTESVALEKLSGPLGKGHYVFFMEFGKGSIVKCQDLANEIEQALLSLYAPYKRYKDCDSIGPLRINQVRCGTFEGLKAYIWNDTPHTQFKMPRVLRKESALKYLLDQAV